MSNDNGYRHRPRGHLNAIEDTPETLFEFVVGLTSLQLSAIKSQIQEVHDMPPPEKGPGGTPITLNYSCLAAWAATGMNVDNLATLLGMDRTTFYKYKQKGHDLYDEKFDRFYRLGRALGALLVNKKQFDVAMTGNVPMLIFLGKNLCGQQDSPPPPIDHDEGSQDDALTPEEIVNTRERILGLA